MTSQLIVGKELRRLGKGVIDLARSRRLSQVGGGGVTRTYLVALGLFCVLPIGATAALYYSIPNETLIINLRRVAWGSEKPEPQPETPDQPEPDSALIARLTEEILKKLR